MPFINIRSEGKSKTNAVTRPARSAVSKGKAFPDKPKSRDGKYEGTIGQQTKLTSF